jgi:hypothetical protein
MFLAKMIAKILIFATQLQDQFCQKDGQNFDVIFGQKLPVNFFLL